MTSYTSLHTLVLAGENESRGQIHAVVSAVFPESKFVDCETGEQALAALAASAFDLIVIVLDRGESERAAVLQSVRQGEGYAPVVIFTPSDRQDELYRTENGPDPDWSVILTDHASDTAIRGAIQTAIRRAERRWEINHLQRAFQSSMLQYRNLFDEVPDIIFLCDRSGCLLDVNATASRVFGRPKDQLLLQPISEVFGLDQDTFHRLLTAAIDPKGPIEDLEVEFHPAGGAAIFGLTHMITMRHVPGRPLLFQGVIKDISHRKELEGRIRDSELKYKTLYELAQISSSSLQIEQVAQESLKLIANATGAIGALLFLNRRSDELNLIGAEGFSDGLRTEYRRAPAIQVGRGVVGRWAISGRAHSLDRRHFDDLHPVLAHWANEIGAGRMVGCPLGPANLSVPTSILILAFAPTAETRTEDEMLVALTKTLEMGVNNCHHYASAREAENKYRQLWENAPAFFVSILKGGVVFEVNQTAAKALGYKLQDMIGRRFTDFLALEDHDTFTRHHARLVEQGVESSYELKLMRRDGESLVVQATAEPLRNNEGVVIGEKTVLHDITRDKELEQQRIQLIQAGKLATLGEMATGIAHELNQPLSGIRTNAQLLSRLVARGKADRERILADQEQIIGLVDRMSHIIEHMRGFSRQDTQRFTSFNINQSIEGCMSLMGERLRLNAIEIVRDVPADPPLVRGEPYQIEQVLLNLIGNARYAVDEKERRLRDAGEHGAYQKCITLRLTEPGPGEICLSVSDNGIGIDGEVMERIFQPFYTTKPVGEGTGLGLSISYAIITNHGGRMEASSAAGEGTTFTIHLPVDREPARSEPVNDTEDTLAQRL